MHRTRNDVNARHLRACLYEPPKQSSRGVNMPNVSQRQQLLNEVEDAMRLAAMDSLLRDDDWFSDEDDFFWASDDEGDDMYQVLAGLHYMICERRFLNPRRSLGKSKDYVLNYFLNQPDDQFRKICRVSRETFNHILNLIEFDPIFHNVSTCEQVPVHWQLACALDRLGNDGQGVSHARSKIIWGIGTGTVHLYTKRVVHALWGLRDMFIRWPTVEEREQISRRLEDKGFKGCVGFVDGTTIPLHKKPAIHGNVYMDRKKRYSVNAQVACDDQNRITFFMTGHPGSCGDNRVWSGSIIAQRPELAFSGRQYLLADSAYAATPTIIPSYRENQQDNRFDPHEPQAIERFNTFLAKARVVNEHTIGILKMRWSSMRGMRVDIHQREDMERFVHQATACVILHNICVQRDPWEEDMIDQDEGEDLPEGDGEIRQTRVLSPGQRRRWEVRRACLAFHDRG